MLKLDTIDSPEAEAIHKRLKAVPFSADLRLVPIRHHSPACAAQVRALIRRDRPDAVLIEGPSDADSLLSFVEKSRPPVALYSFFAAAVTGGAEKAAAGETARYRCFYPFAEFSPEWAALKEARKTGAEVRFIDLPYPQMLAAAEGRQADLQRHDATRLSEQKLAGAESTRALVRKSGCRDFNEWWDRAFESGRPCEDPETFFRDMLIFAMLLRSPGEETDPETAAREAFMAQQIRNARESHSRILVITGAYHTEALARRLNGAPPAEPSASSFPEKEPSGDGGTYLVPYSLHRLDAANGYAAGIPDCGYYQRVWEIAGAEYKGNPHEHAAAEVVGEVGRRLREKGETVSFAEIIEAAALSRRLAALRGVFPGRPEILDAMETAFIKGSGGDEGAAARRIRDLMIPDLTGTLPDDLPPASIVRDFRTACEKFSLPMHWGDVKTRNLDIYRSPRHREISRFFHRLRFLGIPYAALKAGPDFAAGKSLERVREVWEIQWEAETEAFLTEQMRYGGQISDAALNLLIEKLDAVQGGAEAVVLLIRALMMGLHAIIRRIIAPVSEWIQRESDFVRLVGGLRGLYVAHTAQHLLETGRIPRFTELLGAGFTRACSLLLWTGETDQERLRRISEGLMDMNSFLVNGESWADRSLFLGHVEHLCADIMPPVIRGTGAGILRTQQVWDLEKTRTVLKNLCMQAEHDAEALGGFLSGFLPAARTELLQYPELLEQMTETIGSWDERIFLDALPALRLAFTGLAPRETREFAVAVQRLTGETASITDHPVEWSLADLQTMGVLRERVKDKMKLWGMESK